MPKDDEDEGQDGESIVSQDILDWEGHIGSIQAPEEQNESYMNTERRAGRSLSSNCVKIGLKVRKTEKSPDDGEKNY